MYFKRHLRAQQSHTSRHHALTTPKQSQRQQVLGIWDRTPHCHQEPQQRLGFTAFGGQSKREPEVRLWTAVNALVFYLYLSDFGSRRCGQDSCILLAGGDLQVVRLLAVSGSQINSRNEYVVIFAYHSRMQSRLHVNLMSSSCNSSQSRSNCTSSCHHQQIQRCRRLPA